MSNTTDWDAIHAAETETHMTRFAVAARKIEKLISRLAAGEELELEIMRAIDRLENRANKPEIRGNETARESCWNVARELRTARQAAAETGAQVRRNARDERIAELAVSIRENRMNDWRNW